MNVDKSRRDYQIESLHIERSRQSEHDDQANHIRPYCIITVLNP